MKTIAPVLLAIAIGALSGLAGALWPRSPPPAPVAATSPTPAPLVPNAPDSPQAFELSAASSPRSSRLEIAVFCQQRAARSELFIRRLVEAAFTKGWSAPSAGLKTDAAGRAEQALSAGVYLITARSAGCAILNQSVVVRQGEDQQSVELQLGASLAVFGTVRDAATGQPIAGALVQAQQTMKLQSRHRELTPLDEQWTALTDSIGRYRIEDVGSGDFAVHASAGGFADGKLDLKVDALDARADLALEGAGTIEGRVLHATGPATVKDLRGEGKTVFVNADGAFRLSVAPGAHLLYGEDSAGATGLIRVQVGARAVTRDVALSLDAGGKISGRALLAGAPAVCARVWIRAESDPYEIASSSVAADGAFVLERVPPGRYWVLAECPDGEHADRLGVEPNRGPLELALQQAAGVTGRVVDQSGRAVAGAEVEVSQPQREPALAVTDGQGRFELGRLIAGVVHVEATAGQRRSIEQSVQLVEGQDVALELQVQQTGEISGRVTGNTEGVNAIGAWSKDRNLGDSSPLGADGTYSLRLIPGHYKVNSWLVGSSELIFSEEVDLAAGQQLRLDFVVPKTKPRKMETSAPGTIGASFDDGPGGVAVSWIISESPAARAGLAVGDLVLGIDGKPVARSVDAFALCNGAPDTQVRIALRRGGVDQELVITRAGR